MPLTPAPRSRPRSVRPARTSTPPTARQRSAGTGRHAVGLIRDDLVIDQGPDPIQHQAGRGVHDYARSMAFLTELDGATWMARYSAAERLGDPFAVTSVSGYAAWLRRTAAAWSAVSMPTSAQAGALWPFTSLPATILDIGRTLDADLHELALSSGGPHGRGSARHCSAARPLNDEEVDAAYVAGAAYVAVAAGQEVAVLAADVDHLSATASPTPLPRHYVQRSLQVAAVRNPLRRELADWVDAAGPEAAERVVLTAQILIENLAAALAAGPHSGW